MNKIVNFHLPADDAERAAAFYKNVFGWEFAAAADSPRSYLVHEPAGGDSGPGIPAAITTRDSVLRAPVPTIEVEDIDATLLTIAMKGGRQAAVHDIPAIGRFAYAMDSEDNVIALLQRVKS